jgi:hypothetical protein
MKMDEIKILVTKESYLSTVDWLKKNTCLIQESTPQPLFVDKDSYIYFIRVNEGRFDWHCNVYRGVYTHMTDDVKRELKERYPKERHPKEDENTKLKDKVQELKKENDHLKEKINKIAEISHTFA